jgi:hypothetical protein
MVLQRRKVPKTNKDIDIAPLGIVDRLLRRGRASSQSDHIIILLHTRKKEPGKLNQKRLIFVSVLLLVSATTSFWIAFLLVRRSFNFNHARRQHYYSETLEIPCPSPPFPTYGTPEFLPLGGPK